MVCTLKPNTSKAETGFELATFEAGKLASQNILENMTFLYHIRYSEIFVKFFVLFMKSSSTVLDVLFIHILILNKNEINGWMDE